MERETEGCTGDEPVADGAEVAGELEALEEKLQAGIDVMQARLARLDERTTALMRAHPGATILVALGAGYLIGRLASRR